MSQVKLKHMTCRGRQTVSRGQGLTTVAGQLRRAGVCYEMAFLFSELMTGGRDRPHWPVKSSRSLCWLHNSASSHSSMRSLTRQPR